MLKAEFTGEVMIFAKEYEGKTFYSLGISKKKQDGTYMNGYVNCVFRKGVNVPNKTKINIKKAWLDFYLKDKRTVTQIFISEFESAIPEGFEEVTGFAALDDDIPF